MLPKFQTNEQLAAVLRQTADLVEQGQSLEGSLHYESGPGVGEGADAPWGYHVLAVVRDNPGGGQGGVHMLGTMDIADAPVAQQAAHTESVLPLFMYALRRELRANYYKGDWRKWSPKGIIGDLLYHAAKLAFRQRALDKAEHNHDRNPSDATVQAVAKCKQRVLEQAADCGNLAMFVADRVGALTTVVVYARAEEADLAGSTDYDADNAAALATQTHPPAPDPDLY